MGLQAGLPFLSLPLILPTKNSLFSCGLTLSYNQAVLFALNFHKTPPMYKTKMVKKEGNV